MTVRGGSTASFRQLLVKDKVSGWSFLADTGAVVSVLPASGQYISKSMPLHLPNLVIRGSHVFLLQIIHLSRRMVSV